MSYLAVQNPLMHGAARTSVFSLDSFLYGEKQNIVLPAIFRPNDLVSNQGLVAFATLTDTFYFKIDK